MKPINSLIRTFLSDSQYSLTKFCGDLIRKVGILMFLFSCVEFLTVSTKPLNGSSTVHSSSNKVTWQKAA